MYKYKFNRQQQLLTVKPIVSELMVLLGLPLISLRFFETGTILQTSCSGTVSIPYGISSVSHLLIEGVVA